jgi:acyl-CoA thioesterase
VPPELTLHILRPPIGDWICLDAVTHLQSEGIGLTTANLFDQQGQVAHSAQSLFIARRAQPDHFHPGLFPAQAGRMEEI